MGECQIPFHTVLVALVFSFFWFHSSRAQSAGLVQDSPAIPLCTGDSLLVFVSDTQRPLFFETLLLSPNGNETARDLIFKEILGLRPNAIVHLGDIVSLGFSPGSWEAFDDFLARTRQEHVPVYPTLGNHELLLFPSYGLERFLDRFPWYSKTGYVVRIGRLGIVQLNSNFTSLSDDERQHQVRWLEHSLVELEADTTVDAVIVGCHHPPFTNSTVVDPSFDVQGAFVPLFLRFSKCKLFISGHAHACEHFIQSGKDFLVIGGGGGLLHTVLTGGEERYRDVSGLHHNTRMFHYLECRIAGATLSFSVRMVKNDFGGFETVHEFTLPLYHDRLPKAAQ
jgi:hypothetical protein